MNHEVTHLVQFAKLEKKMEQKWRHEVEEHESHIRLKPLCFFAHIIIGYNFLIVSQQLEIIQSTHLVLCYSYTHTHTKHLVFEWKEMEIWIFIVSKLTYFLKSSMCCEFFLLFCPSLGWTISNFGTRFDKGLGCAKSDGEPWTSSSHVGLMVWRIHTSKPSWFLPTNFNPNMCLPQYFVAWKL